MDSAGATRGLVIAGGLIVVASSWGATGADPHGDVTSSPHPLRALPVALPPAWAAPWLIIVKTVRASPRGPGQS